MARIKNIPKRVDYDLYEGDDFALTLHFTTQIDPDNSNTQVALDVSTWSFKATWRPNEDSTQSVEWNIDMINAETGEIVISVPSAMIDSMKAISVSGVWDLQVTYPPGQIKTFAAGYVYIIKEVTYADIQ